MNMAEFEVENTKVIGIERSEMLGSVISEIKEVLEKSRSKVAAEVNRELLATYWKIGEIIVKYEQNDKIRAAYGEKTLV